MIVNSEDYLTTATTLQTFRRWCESDEQEVDQNPEIAKVDMISWTSIDVAGQTDTARYTSRSVRFRAFG